MKQTIILLVAIALTGILVAKNNNKMKHPNTVETKKSVKMTQVRNGNLYSESIYVMEENDTTVSPFGTMSPDRVREYIFANGNTFHSQSKIMIKFKKECDRVVIKEIESRYGLNLERKMNSGDYLFGHRQGDTLYIINAVLKDYAVCIDRISPNMVLNMKPM